MALAISLMLFNFNASAQFKFRQPPNRQDPESLSQISGQNLWYYFLNARNIGSFQLEGTLQYRPANSTSRYFDFFLKGNWNQDQQFTSLSMANDDGLTFTRKVTIRDGQVIHSSCLNDNGEEETLQEIELTQPLVEQLPFTWADVLMPYIYWESVSYLGPERYLGRPAHRFVLTNPDPDDFISKVIVTLDEDYAIMLKSDVLDKNDTILKRVRISGFKQFNNEWMFSGLVWEHRSKRESVFLKVSNYFPGS